MEDLSTIFETERLRLRPFNLNDSAFIIHLLNSPGWLEYIGDRHVITEEQANQYLINGPLLSYQKNGFGLSMVELKNDKTPIGMCGILRRDHLEKPDIGFALLPEFSNKGYGYEIAKATLIHAADKLQLPVIWAITSPQNKPSIRLLEKIGLHFIKNISFPNENEELLLFTNEE